MKLINAKPSPFGRKVMIALNEKAIPFEPVWDIPWHADTTVAEFNPLEQLPILIADGGEIVYESSFILEWLEQRYPEPGLIPADGESVLEMKRLRVLAVGVMEAIVRINFELARPKRCQSGAWIQRHHRKVVGGVGEIGRLIGERPFAVADRFTLADIEVGAVLGHLDFLIDSIPPLGEVLAGASDWREPHPGLDSYVSRLEARPSFVASPREMVDIDFEAVTARHTS